MSRYGSSYPIARRESPTPAVVGSTTIPRITSSANTASTTAISRPIILLKSSVQPNTYHLSIQELINDDGDSTADQHIELSTPAPDPFDENTPIDIAALHEVASSLTGRLADVYEALLIKYAGGKERITFNSLAEKWGVSHTQIGYDRDKIFRMIRKAVEAAREK